jgi:hypothetical protein
MFLTHCILSFKIDSMYVTVVVYVRFKLPEDDRIRSKHVVVFIIMPMIWGAGAAQSVLCMSMDWTTGVRSPIEAEDFSSSL